MPTQDESDPTQTAAERTQRENAPKQSEPSAIRQRRVDQYEREELENPVAFQACLAAIQADQIRIGFALGDAVKQMLTIGVPTAEHIRELEPSLSIYLRVTRQIERYRQLEIRQAEVQQNVDAIQVHSSDQDSQLDAEDKPSPRVPK